MIFSITILTYHPYLTLDYYVKGVPCVALAKKYIIGIEILHGEARDDLCQFDTVNNEQHTFSVASLEKSPYERGAQQCLTRAGCHFKEKAVFAVFYRILQSNDGFLLIGPEEAQTVGINIALAFSFILPRGVGGIIGALGKNNVVVAYGLCNKALGVGNTLLVAHYRCRLWKGGYDIGVAALKIPEVMQIAIGQDDKTAIL